MECIQKYVFLVHKDIKALVFFSAGGVEKSAQFRRTKIRNEKGNENVLSKRKPLRGEKMVLS